MSIELFIVKFSFSYVVIIMHIIIIGFHEEEFVLAQTDKSHSMEEHFLAIFQFV